MIKRLLTNIAHRYTRGLLMLAKQIKALEDEYYFQCGACASSRSRPHTWVSSVMKTEICTCCAVVR